MFRSQLRHALLLCTFLLAALPVASGASQSVSEEILEILKESGRVSEEKYQELKVRAGAEASAAEKAATDYRVYWKHGLRFVSPDGAFALKLGGRIQNDWAILLPSGAIQDAFDEGSPITGGKIRRARLFLSGTLYKHFLFKAQYDFAGGRVGIRDLYLGMQDIPFIDTILVGHMKEPYSLEQLTSSNHITFMERGASATLDSARNTGVTIYPRFAGNHLGVDLGAYLNTDGDASVFSMESEYNVTMRVYGLPWWQDEGRKLFYLGGSYSHHFRNDDDVSFSARPNTSFGPTLIATGAIPTNGNDLVNLSAAVVKGPFSAQAEYSQAFIDSPSGPDVSFLAWFAEVSWFLTGEYRPFNRKKGIFTQVKPARSFDLGPGSGWGAVQVAARYSHFDHDSGPVRGGQLNNTTLGLNWYLNQAFRVTLNYVYTDRAPTGSENIWQCRFQVAF
ncbi:MAG: porin [Deltaproteobacteria bacterium]